MTWRPTRLTMLQIKPVINHIYLLNISIQRCTHVNFMCCAGTARLFFPKSNSLLAVASFQLSDKTKTTDSETHAGEVTLARTRDAQPSQPADRATTPPAHLQRSTSQVALGPKHHALFLRLASQEKRDARSSFACFGVVKILKHVQRSRWRQKRKRTYPMIHF